VGEEFFHAEAQTDRQTDAPEIMKKSPFLPYPF